MQWENLLSELVERREGAAKFLSFPPSIRSNGFNNEIKTVTVSKDMPVFYNPQMVINRDFSILFTEAFLLTHFRNKETVFFDTMSASGIRSIRMALEMPFLRILMNDLNPMALRLIRHNMGLNNLKEEPERIELYQKEANIFLMDRLADSDFGTIIDVDPFGTPNLFVENAIKALRRGGMLCVTATDTPVLFGIKKNASIRKYGIESLKNGFFKETGLRLLMTYIARLAHMHDLYIIPRFSLSQEHFIRIFISFGKSEGEIKKNIEEMGFIVSCDECFYYNPVKGNNRIMMEIERMCPNCGAKLKIVGPIWLGPLHDLELTETLLNLCSKKQKQDFELLELVKKIANLAIQEEQVGIGYYNIHQICDKFKLNIKKYSYLQEKIEEAGYRFSRTFFDDKCIRTTMPAKELIELLKN